jgi:4-hydroxybenzoate polyprenyltransferase
MLHRIRHLLEMIRFSHTLFAMPFAMLSAVLAWRQNWLDGAAFRWRDLIGIVLCMVFARSAAMTFNRIVDRGIDAANPRTASRHLPSGVLTVGAAVAFWLSCSLGFVASTLMFFPNWWPICLALPVLAFLFGYSYAKRFTSSCHYWLAAALMLSPLSAWIAIRGGISWIPVLVGAVVFFWVGGFDIIYACQDTEFDRQAKLFSIPAQWGVPAALRLAMISHVVMLACLVTLWFVAGMGWVFPIGIAVVAGLLAYEHAIVTPNDLIRVNVAFFHTNAVISMALLLMTIADVWWASWR